MTNDNRYQLAYECIIAAFSKVPAMTHETTHTLVEYVNTLADAWQKVHELLRESGLLGRSLATMMEWNLELSGNSYKECIAQRIDPECDYEDVEWLFSMYDIHLSAIADILSEVIAPRP